MPPISKLFLPPTPLAGCVMAGLFRDTRGAGLSAKDRVNHFPASPLVSVTLVEHGQLHLIPPGADWRVAEEQPEVPRLSAMAPQPGPVSSWAQGDVVALTLGVYPDAWQALGGEMSCAAVPKVFDAALDQFRRARDPDAGWQKLCAALNHAWSQRDTGHRPKSLGSWAKSIATRAALSDAGRSIRSIERRIKRYSGQTRQTLEFFAAFEQLHARSLDAVGRPLAEIAMDAGYADQSHMGRAVRRATGFTPARLNKAIATEEPFWCYRLLGERY